MTETAKPAPKPRRAARPKPAPEPRADLLRRLLADIEEHDHHAHRPALWERLIDVEGARLRTDEWDVTWLTLAGLIAHSTAGRTGALMVWTRLARQELLAEPEAPAGAA